MAKYQIEVKVTACVELDDDIENDVGIEFVTDDIDAELSVVYEGVTFTEPVVESVTILPTKEQQKDG